MRVKEMTIEETYCVEPTMCLMEVAAAMRRRGLTIIPVCDDDKLVGIVSDKDLIINCLTFGRKVLACTVGELMTLDPISIPLDMDTEEAARIMSEAKMLHMPVVNNGFFIGVISLRDVAYTIQDNDSPVKQALWELAVPAHTISRN